MSEQGPKPIAVEEKTPQSKKRREKSEGPMKFSLDTNGDYVISRGKWSQLDAIAAIVQASLDLAPVVNRDAEGYKTKDSLTPEEYKGGSKDKLVFIRTTHGRKVDTIIYSAGANKFILNGDLLRNRGSKYGPEEVLRRAKEILEGPVKHEPEGGHQQAQEILEGPVEKQDKLKKEKPTRINREARKFLKMTAFLHNIQFSDNPHRREYAAQTIVGLSTPFIIAAMMNSDKKDWKGKPDYYKALAWEMRKRKLID